MCTPQALTKKYQQWYYKCQYHQILDPSPNQLRAQCHRMRHRAKKDRVLLHYNGHGVPAPTEGGAFEVDGLFSAFVQANQMCRASIIFYSETFLHWPPPHCHPARSNLRRLEHAHPCALLASRLCGCVCIIPRRVLRVQQRPHRIRSCPRVC